MDENVIWILGTTALVVLSIGATYLLTHRKLDDIQQDVRGGNKQLNNRLDMEGKEAAHGVNQLRLRFAELWHDRSERFKEWWNGKE